MSLRFFLPNGSAKNHPRSLGPRYAVRTRPTAQNTKPSNGPLASSQATELYNLEAADGMGVVLWHWGRVGAGPKFTFELARGLDTLPNVSVSVSASAGSDLDALCTAGGLTLDRVRTFDGSRGTIKGNARAFLGLLGIATLAKEFSKTIVARHPDIALCAFQSVWDLAAINVLSSFKGRFVLILHDASFRSGDDYPLRTQILGRQIAAADGLIVLTDYVGREAANRFNFPADRIWTVPHGSFSFGVTRSSARRYPRRRALRLLFLGRIMEYKGLGLLLEAYRILQSRKLSVTLNIAGEGDMSSYARAIAKASDIEVENRWLDEIEIGRCLRNADIVVLPYTDASQSGVAAAAMTEALPVVVTPVGGLAEQVRHESTGVVAAAVTAEAVAAAIERLVVDEALYEKCSRGALHYANNELSWTAVAEKVQAVLKDVARRPRRSAK